MFSGKKKYHFFQMLQKILYSSRIFLERPSFQNIQKRKLWFLVQWERCYQQSRGNTKDLLAVLKSFCGCKILWCKTLTFQLPPGLAIFGCMFRNSDNSSSAIVVPNKLMSEIDKKFHHCVISSTHIKNLSIQQFQLYQVSCCLQLEVN